MKTFQISVWLNRIPVQPTSFELH